MIQTWRTNKGKGTFVVPLNFNVQQPILEIISKMVDKTPSIKCTIIVKDFEERQHLLDVLKQNETINEGINNSNIKVLTESYFNSSTFRISLDLLIIVRPNEYTMKLDVELFRARFKLVFIDNNLDNASKLKLYSTCPHLATITTEEVKVSNANSPVEERRIPVNIIPDSDTDKLYKYYNEYVQTTLNIFGSLEVIDQARTGNKDLNISSNQICANIAYNNGWHENLDMSSPINVQVDELFNPSKLKDRVVNIYDIIRKRNTLLAEYVGKLDVIVDIVKRNQSKKILIISKKGEFANEVTNAINKELGDICGNYHDNCEDIPARNEDGSFIKVKSGINAGQIKYLKSKAQKTLNERLFNEDKLSVLSANSAIDKDLCAKVDVVIITSPQCETIEAYLYRLNSLFVSSTPLLLYNVYISNSAEERLLNGQKLGKNHYIKNDTDLNTFSANYLVD